MIYRAAGALNVAFERSEDATKGSQGPLNHVFSKTEASNKDKNTGTRENAVDSEHFRMKNASNSDEESLRRSPCSWHSEQLSSGRSP